MDSLEVRVILICLALLIACGLAMLVCTVWPTVTRLALRLRSKWDDLTRWYDSTVEFIRDVQELHRHNGIRRRAEALLRAEQDHKRRVENLMKLFAEEMKKV